MKKLLPLACTTLLLAACGSDWGSCDKPTCCQKREPLSERSFGSNRGYGNVSIQYSDQDYKGRASCCDKMKGEKKEAKKARKMSAAAPAAGTPAKAEEKPAKKRGLFF